MTPLLLVVLLIGLAACGSAPTPAPTGDLSLTYSWNTGSLPPPYHRAETVRLDASGGGVLRAERSYGAGPSHEVAFQLSPVEVEALRAELLAAGLFDAWAEDPRPPVGGASWTLEATVGDRTATVPRFVTGRGADKARIREAMLAAVPADARAELDGWLAETEAE